MTPCLSCLSDAHVGNNIHKKKCKRVSYRYARLKKNTHTNNKFPALRPKQQQIQ